MNPISMLNQDIYLEIFSKLPLETLLKTVILVCKAWKKAVEDPRLWQRLCKQDQVFPIDTKNTDWKKTYFENFWWRKVKTVEESEICELRFELAGLSFLTPEYVLSQPPKLLPNIYSAKEKHLTNFNISGTCVFISEEENPKLLLGDSKGSIYLYNLLDLSKGPLSWRVCSTQIGAIIQIESSIIFSSQNTLYELPAISKTIIDWKIEGIGTISSIQFLDTDRVVCAHEFSFTVVNKTTKKLEGNLTNKDGKRAFKCVGYNEDVFCLFYASNKIYKFHYSDHSDTEALEPFFEFLESPYEGTMNNVLYDFKIKNGALFTAAAADNMLAIIDMKSRSLIRCFTLKIPPFRFCMKKNEVSVLSEKGLFNLNLK